MARYELLLKIASGGMGAVYVGRLRGAMGFEQLVAIKKPHAHLLDNPEIKNNLMAEARVASRIRHANVVGVRDVEVTDDAFLLVMDYVEGASLLELAKSGGDRRELLRAGLRIILDACAGLQAAHDLLGEDGRPLGLVHRDISPHNILVGIDGVGRLADFGIAKSLYGKDPSTAEGTIKGKLAFMAPECFNGGVDQRSDIFAMGIVLWELLTGHRLFAAKTEAETLKRVLGDDIPMVSSVAPDVGTFFDGIVARALERNPAERFATAMELLTSLQGAVARAGLDATHQDVARFVRAQVEQTLVERRARVNASIQAEGSTTEGVEVAAQTRSLSFVTINDAKKPKRGFLFVGAGLVAFALAITGAMLRGGKSAAEPARAPVSPIESAPAATSDAASTPAPAAPSAEPPVPSAATASATSAAPARAVVKPKAPKAAPKADRPFRNPY